MDEPLVNATLKRESKKQQHVNVSEAEPIHVGSTTSSIFGGTLFVMPCEEFIPAIVDSDPCVPPSPCVEILFSIGDWTGVAEPPSSGGAMFLFARGDALAKLL